MNKVKTHVNRTEKECGDDGDLLPGFRSRLLFVLNPMLVLLLEFEFPEGGSICVERFWFVANSGAGAGGVGIEPFTEDSFRGG
jgi:hypothetical protein